MKRKQTLFLLTAFLVLMLSSVSYPVELKRADPAMPATQGDLDVSIRVTGGKGSVFKPGRDIGITFQTNKDAYVVIYNIDSEGYVHLLFPEDGKIKMIEGRKAYFLPERESGVHWEAGDKTGIEYIHAMAVADRDIIKEDELYFLSQNRKLSSDEKFRIDMDPLLAFNMIDEGIMVDAEVRSPATDYTYFYINRRVDYPRFLCAKCHGQDKFSDPYNMDCPEIVIEKVAYEEELDYPYPALFEVRHTDEDSDSYTSTSYAENITSEWDDEDYDDEDTKIYLSIHYGYHDYPYRYYYNPFWSDFYWWGFGWSWYWTDYYWYRPFYTWWHSPYYWYPYQYYWAYNCGYSWWWDHCYNRHYYYSRRPIHGYRTLAKRSLHYNRALSGINRKRALEGSRLAKTRAANETRKLERSRLAKRLSSNTSKREAMLRDRRELTRDKDIRRRVIYDGANAKLRTRDVKKSQDAIRTRSPRIKTENRNRVSPKTTDRTVKERIDKNRGSGNTRSIKKTEKTRSKSSEKSVKDTSKNKSPRRSSSSKSSSSNVKQGQKKTSSSSARSRSVNRRSSSSTRRSAPASSSRAGRSSGSSRSSGGSSKPRRG